MNLRYSKYISTICIVYDVIVIIVLSFLFNYLHSGEGPISMNTMNTMLKDVNIYLLLFISWYFIAQKTRLYKIYRSSDIISIIRKTALQIVFFGIVIYAVNSFRNDHTTSTKAVFLFLLTLFFATLLLRVSFRLLLRKHRIRGGNLRNIVFIDSNNSDTLMLIDLLKKRKVYGMYNCGVFLKNIEPNEKDKIYPFDLNVLEDFVVKHNVSMIFFSVGGALYSHLSEIQQLSYRHRIQIIYIPNTIDDMPNNLRIDYFETIPVLVNKKLPLDNASNQIVKRLFDVIFSSVIIVTILSWLYPIIALLIKLDSKGDVLFIQDRNGLNGETFRCFKFRTMRPNEEAGIVSTHKGDQRITRIGRFLRKTSLDELPQFLNVFMGDMSIVGPRPHMVKQDNYYNKLLPKYCIRYFVKPGITGLSQVSGLRGEIRTDEDMEKRAMTDMYYVQKWSILLDCIIVLKTVYYMVVGDKHAI